MIRTKCYKDFEQIPRPICRSCKYFRPPIRNRFTIEDESKGFCTRKKRIDIITGNTTYTSASHERYRGDCAVDGRYFRSASVLSMVIRDMNIFSLIFSITVFFLSMVWIICLMLLIRSY